MSFLTTKNGTTLFYKDWNKGKPIVFVHACGMTSAFWESLMLNLGAQGIRCIAYDKRGHGRSDDPGHGYDFDALSDDLHSLLEQLDLRDVTLVGHSMGGGEVLRYQTRHGHAGRVSKLALLGTPDYLRLAADNPEGVPEDMITRVLAILSKDFPQWLNDNVDPFYLPETFGISNGIIQWTVNMMLQTSMRALIDCQHSTFTTDLRIDARQITIPTLVIHGDKDASIPLRCGQAIAGMIAGSHLKVYPGAPHGLIVTHAEQLGNDLLSFIHSERQ